MAKNLTLRLDDESAEAVERRRRDSKFKAKVRRIVEQDRELLERLAK